MSGEGCGRPHPAIQRQEPNRAPNRIDDCRHEERADNGAHLFPGPKATRTEDLLILALYATVTPVRTSIPDATVESIQRPVGGRRLLRDPPP